MSGRVVETKTVASGTPFLTLLCVLFVGLKLTGYITWSWWWVLAPLWLPLSLILVFAAFAVVIALIFGDKS